MTSFEKHADPTFEQDISIIFWLNTDELASHISGPSLGYQKVDVLDILKTSDSVSATVLFKRGSKFKIEKVIDNNVYLKEK